MATATNPMIPYTAMLQSPWGKGVRIEINGASFPHSNGFAVNLKTFSGSILLHFNVRFNENVVVINHNMHGAWGTEVRPGPFPCYRGQPFSINLVAEHNHIAISVNGAPFHSWHEHFNRWNEIKMVEITGDVQVHLFREHPHHHHGHHFPGFPPAFPAPGMAPAAPSYGLPVPYHLPVPGGFSMGRQVYITGTPNGNFTVNLKCGQWEGADIALHFDVRFNERAIVRNSFMSGGWGGEERHGHFAFNQGAPFTIQIICEHHHFRVMVNGAHFVDFGHRLRPMHRIECVEVKGAVALTSVNL